MLGQVKALIKPPLQALAARSVPWTLRRHSDGLLIITYHRVLPPGHPAWEVVGPGMITPPAHLEMQLQLLREHFDLVHLDDWLDRGTEGGRCACAITSDDGWGDTWEFAWPILQRLKVPATLFLVADFCDTGRINWTDQLARILTNEGRDLPAEILAGAGWLTELCPELVAGPVRDREVINRVTGLAKTQGDQLMQARCDTLVTDLGLGAADDRFTTVSWDQVRSMGATGLMRFGSHTLQHRRLRDDLPAEDLEAEIVRSRAAIEAQTGAPARTFCYPNGDLNAAGLDIVRRHYDGACTTATGFNGPDSDRALLRRFDIHENAGTQRDFLARISGWFG